MDFAPSPLTTELAEALRAFIYDTVVPSQAAYDAAVVRAPGEQPAVVADLQQAARDAGLWNLCVRDPDHGPGLSFVDYAPLAEMMGPHPLAQEATNCDPPSNINADAMIIYGSPEQRERWLLPQLYGRI